MSGMTLLDWRRIDKGALIGRAKVLLPSGLEISDIGVFARGGERWAQPTSEQMRDATGQPVTDPATGKQLYRSPVRWSTRDLQQRFSDPLIAPNRSRARAAASVRTLGLIMNFEEARQRLDRGGPK